MAAAVQTLQRLQKKYDQAVDIFNEAAHLVEANGWSEDAEFLEIYNGIADELEKIRTIYSHTNHLFL